MNGDLVAARLLLALHVAFVGFIVIGLSAILVGGLLGWDRTRNRAFRLAHLAAIGFVLLRVWSGVPCFLTTAEIWLRARAGGAFPRNELDGLAQAIVFRDADPVRFRRSVTGWALLSILAVPLTGNPKRKRRSPESGVSENDEDRKRLSGNLRPPRILPNQ